MADETPINPATDAAPDDAPQAAAIAQYIKDLSVESPNSPQVFQWQGQPQVDVQFNINVDRIADEVHEVVLRINVSAKSDQGTHFLVDLSYGGVFAMTNIPEDARPPYLLIEAPRLLFPFARQIVAEAVQNLGFPPLLLDPIDFAGAFVAQAQAQADATGAGSNGGSNGGSMVTPALTNPTVEG